MNENYTTGTPSHYILFELALECIALDLCQETTKEWAPHFLGQALGMKAVGHRGRATSPYCQQ